MSWARVRSEFEALCDLPAATRDERLQQIASTDGWLANELRALFAQADAQTSFLERALPDGAPTRGAALAAPGLRIGRFELVRPLGSGGMGAVWQARQTDPDRDVAIKLVTRAADSADARWRFRHEVQVLARLAHPAIATLFEAGEADLGGSAVAWFAMELVDGAVDLLTWARQTHAPVTERIAMFERLCDAVDYGHRHGVLHRDLKPGNVLVGRDGRLKLIDFGVARALDVDTADAMQRTAAGEVVGTLQYMSPEQLRADASAIGAPCDVYALGVLLYHLLCDRPPFDLAAIGFAGFVAAVLEQEPASPFAARPDLPPDLGWIALRALAKVPERRYATVRELVDDLQRFRRHEPVRARAPDRWYRCRKFVRRHRTALTVAMTATAAIGVGIAFLLQGLAEARAGLREARRGTALSRETTAVTVAMFDAIDDTEQSRDLRVHQLLDAAEPAVRAAKDPSVEFTIRNLRARIYARLQRFDAAAREFERAAELAAGPAQHEVLLQADDAVSFRAYFGTALIRAGQRERGEAMLRAAIEAVAAPPAQPAFGRVYGEFCKFLARISAFEEQYGAAEQMCRWAERHGDRHAELEAKQFLADAACGLGRFEQAIPWAEAVYRANEVVPGSLAEADCAPLANYVRILAEAGKFELAEPLYPELVATMKRVFGPTHDSTLTVLTNYCEVLRQRGKPDEALASLREVVASYEARGGPPTLEYLGAVNNLGMTLNLAGRFAEAEPHLRRAAELATSLLDARDPNGPMIRFNHAGCLAWMKQWQAAEPALLAEYDKARELLPPGHAVLGKFERTIADAYKANGFPEQAAEWRAK